MQSISNPLISIIIPTYNRAAFVVETLGSVLTQTYRNWECIIVDDGSSDNTVEIVKDFIKNDHRFKFFHRPIERKPGGNGARNYGFTKSTGDFIKWLDSDDLINKEFLEKELEVFQTTNADLVFSAWNYFDDKGTEYGVNNHIVKENPRNKFDLLNTFGKQDNFNVTHSYLIKREIVLIAGLWNENLKVNQDGEFFCRVICNSEKIESFDYLGALYRKDSGNQVSQKRDNHNWQLRIDSWILIHSYLDIIDKNKFDDFKNGIKAHLYRILKGHNKVNIIDQNKQFFVNEIESEPDKKLKFKIKQYQLLKKVGYFG